VIPAAHGEGFAAMGDGLMGGFAGVADEGVVFNADGGEAVFGVGAAVGAGEIGGRAGEFFYGGFGGDGHG